jgi:hypothetical protein
MRKIFVYFFRQASGDNIEIMKFQQKLFEFYYRFVILRSIRKDNILLLINLNIIISKNMRENFIYFHVVFRPRKFDFIWKYLVRKE